jgi:GT2 family glycosyltransferase
MVSEYSKLKAFKPNLGIITPTIFDINRLIKLYGIEELKTLFLENSSIKSRENLLEKRDELSKEDYFYHLGVSGWKGCYLVSPLFDKFYRSKRFEETVLSQNGNKDKYKFVWHRSEKRIRDGIIDGRIEYLKADTLPGGLHVFESNYIQTYGQFDERFNPYGFEDSELCIRGVEDGLEHYLVRSVFVAHDLDQRFENRAPSVTFFTRGKVRRILMNRHIKDVGEKLYLLYDTFVLFPMAIFQSSNEKIEKKLQYCFNLYYGFLFVPRRRFIESFLRLFNRGTSQR